MLATVLIDCSFILVVSSRLPRSIGPTQITCCQRHADRRCNSASVQGIGLDDDARSPKSGTRSCWRGTARPTNVTSGNHRSTRSSSANHRTPVPRGHDPGCDGGRGSIDRYSGTRPVGARGRCASRLLSGRIIPAMRAGARAGPCRRRALPAVGLARPAVPRRFGTEGRPRECAAHMRARWRNGPRGHHSRRAAPGKVELARFRARGLSRHASRNAKFASLRISASTFTNGMASQRRSTSAASSASTGRGSPFRAYPVNADTHYM